jgi:hypothetical protein
MSLRTVALVVILALTASEVVLLAQRRPPPPPPPPPPIRSGGMSGGGGSKPRAPGVPSRPRAGAPSPRRPAPGQPGTAARGGAAGRSAAAGSAPRVAVPAPRSPEVVQARAAAKPRLDRLRERFNARSTGAGAVAAKPLGDVQPRNQQEQALLQAARDRELKGLNKPVGPRAPLAEAQRISGQHGGRPEDWMKMSGGTTTVTATGQRIEVHYFKNVATGKVVEWTFTRQQAAPQPNPRP